MHNMVSWTIELQLYLYHHLQAALWPDNFDHLKGIVGVYTF